MRVTRKMAFSALGALTVAAATVVGIAQNPGVNTSPYRHPNINAAQRFCEQAIAKVDAAQQANEYDMNGHAAKAKELLAQADAELKQAAVVANHK